MTNLKYKKIVNLVDESNTILSEYKIIKRKENLLKTLIKTDAKKVSVKVPFH